MRRYFIVVLLSATVMAVSCNRIRSVDDSETVAKVGEARLLLSDIMPVVQSGLTPQDSTRIVESYVDMWVKNQLKIQEAEKLFTDSNKEIEAMVESYRNTLLSHRIEQYFTDTVTDASIGDEDIKEYYEQHRADFVLDRTIVKGRLIKLPQNHRQTQQARALISATGAREQDMRDVAEKNGFELIEHDSWVDLAEFTSVLPASAKGDYADLLRKNIVQEVPAGGDLWLVYISSAIDAGEMNPLERVSDNIRRIILNQRRQDAIRNFEDSLYKAAMQNNNIEIRLKQ